MLHKIIDTLPRAGRTQQWRLRSLTAPVSSLAVSVLLAVVFAPLLIAVQALIDLPDVNILFLIPVVIAATRWGLLPALTAALCGTLISAYFLVKPLYSFKVSSPQDFLDLGLFIVVAVIISQLVTQAKVHAVAARQNSDELSHLYAFSRKLTVATEPAEIFAAIQEHASQMVGTNVALIAVDATDDRTWTLPASSAASERLREAARNLQAKCDHKRGALLSDWSTERHWLLRVLSRAPTNSGVLIVDLGRQSATELPAIRERVDSILDDAVITLERLDISSALAEVRSRQESLALREAVIGSVSHRLRTPLAAILGSASILVNAKAVSDDKRLSTLACLIVSEAERLNGDIQKMLDAAALSGAGIEPNITWMETSDLINAAVERESRNLAAHHVRLDAAQGLPLVRADPALVVQALGLAIDNAARYSAAGTTIRISASAVGNEVAVVVEDSGIGFADEESALVFEKFYRGRRVRETTRGSGLGLWIASAFVTACRGRIGIAPRQDQPGTRLTIWLKAASPEEMCRIGGGDE